MFNKLFEKVKNFAWLVALFTGIAMLRGGYNVLEATYFIAIIVSLVLWFAW